LFSVPSVSSCENPSLYFPSSPSPFTLRFHHVRRQPVDVHRHLHTERRREQGHLRRDPASARLTPAAVPFVPTAPGAGPRHAAFSPDGRFVFVINELASTLVTYGYEPATGTLTPLDTQSTLPPGFTGESTTAEVRVHPNGRFVYGSNRGHDSIAVFAFDAASGRLTPLEHVPTGGKNPRNFALSPDGAWLVAANQNSDSLHVFRVDPATGRLTATDRAARVPHARVRAVRTLRASGWLAQSRAQRLLELVAVERLGQHRVRARQVRDLQVALLRHMSAPGHRDDAERGMPPLQLVHQLHPVHLRHQHVRDDDVVWVRGDLPQRPMTIFHANHGVPGHFEQQPGHIADVFFIIDHKDSGRRHWDASRFVPRFLPSSAVHAKTV
jgi:hypothetical protein